MADTNHSSSKSSTSGDGDWTCEECGNLNFARRTTCNRCQKGKAPSAAKKRKLGTEMGKAAAEKSKGLFSADDWQCNKCGNVNWARRQQCNVCNAPKFGEVEERTGFGGGYNDRGVVEYKEREESDDEFDEFGRRKKKNSYGKTISNRDSDQEKAGDVVEEEEEELEDYVEEESNKKDDEEEDDDDEDDDDGDLSKYDLSDWGDLKASTHKDEKSRSRSRSPLYKSKQ